MDVFEVREQLVSDYRSFTAALELVIESFTQLAGTEQKSDREFRTRRLVLEAFDRLDGATAASAAGAEPGR